MVRIDDERGLGGLDGRVQRAELAHAMPERLLLADSTYEVVKAMIMDGIVEPGSRITIDGLSRSLGVSQTPLREALARLESEDLVTKEPMRGYTAAPLITTQRVVELFEFRMLIEPWAAGRAAGRISDEQRGQLRSEIATLPELEPESSSAVTYDVYREIANHDVRFHHLLLTIAGNEAVVQAYAGTNCHMHLFRLSYRRGGAHHTHEEHQAIIDAVSAGDADGARDAMARHLQQSLGRIESALD